MEHQSNKTHPPARSGDVKPCGCPVEAECDHAFSGFRDFCKYNPDAPECRIFDL